eukprot:CAMPEP_0114284398 /NCGR_PEP_ID=MMETSP0059-20121206/4626_1 /TAXON_ID=36894 /ORGANISM="Pyramimonas parkeae, Strain CCMP726" /LENGTH=452 /DNA_ID=CAMNT_0001405215 /DNA_START=172 /DNA_END=1529 /DNA_ORIENTATION=-
MYHATRLPRQAKFRARTRVYDDAWCPRSPSFKSVSATQSINGLTAFSQPFINHAQTHDTKVLALVQAKEASDKSNRIGLCIGRRQFTQVAIAFGGPGNPIGSLTLADDGLQNKQTMLRLDEDDQVSDIVQGLQSGSMAMMYESTLGAGSYKQVWKVLIDGEPYALTTQRFSNANIKNRKQSARNARAELEWKGCAICQHTQTDSRLLFAGGAQSEQMQIAKGGSLVPAKHTMQDIPTRGRKSTFVYALKPLYEFDLRRFQESATSCSEWTALGSVFNSQESALRLVSDLLLAGATLHAAGVIHGDVKPANLMVLDGRAVLIDFGYSQEVREGRCQWSLRGEPEYVLAEAARTQRTCRQGDVFAMGKSIFETLFVYSPPFHEARSYDIHLVEALNAHLLSAMHEDRPVPRFNMSLESQDNLLNVLIGMCTEKLTFAQAQRDFQHMFPDTMQLV